MPNISWNLIQDRAAEFASKWASETYEKGESQSFWSDFLHVYGIDRKRHGAFFEYAIKKTGGKQGFIDMFWPGKLLAEQKSAGKDLAKANIQALDYLQTMPDHDLPEAIVVSDFANFELRMLGSDEITTFKLADFPKHVRSFAFLLDQQSKQYAEEDPVNRKAAEAMAALHNQLRDDNYTGHDLELLLVRLVFCMFADDSGIFERGVFENYLRSRTDIDGSDLGPRLVKVFEVLNTPEDKRSQALDEDLKQLRYVNGGLFADPIRTPDFTAKMRDDLLEAMDLDWSQVSPAIFGSMFQGVMDEKQRRNLGAHYTSEKNILRVIKPLFLDELYEEFAKIRSTKPRLSEFHEKLAGLTFLDPACGCGNFLVITYRELRRLEHKVIEQLHGKNAGLFETGEHGLVKVDVNQMYGIELEEFPALIAQTALWLTDHQMNVEFSRQSGQTFVRLPLTTSATIFNTNALTQDWEELIDPKKINYILGNPPFIGSKMMTETMRTELQYQFGVFKKAGILDFVTAWYAQALLFMHGNPNIKTAFVSTNSITQGEQVAVLWSWMFDRDTEILFAHRTFKWSNDAKGNAAVYCVIIGFAIADGKPKEKRIFDYPDIKGEPVEIPAKNINPYLVDAPNVLVTSRGTPIYDVPLMSFGNMPLEGGNLLMTPEEMEYATYLEPSSKKYIKPFVGAHEFLQGGKRYCFWLVGADPTELGKLPNLYTRIDRVRTFREASKAPSTRKFSTTPALFRDTNNPEAYVLIPRHSSQNRSYIPMGFFDGTTIAGDSCMVIPGAQLYHFGILSSRMHMAWVRTVCGRLKSDYRYSKDIVYNNFIWPDATDAQKAEIEKLAQAVLDARAQFPDATLADLYDPLTMPPALTKAHTTLDRAIDRLYQKEPFESDTARVALLFQKYQEATNNA